MGRRDGLERRRPLGLWRRRAAVAPPGPARLRAAQRQHLAVGPELAAQLLGQPLAQVEALDLHLAAQPAGALELAAQLALLALGRLGGIDELLELRLHVRQLGELGEMTLEGGVQQFPSSYLLRK